MDGEALQDLIFDLDGTVVDSSGDILGCLVQAYLRCGFAEFADRVPAAPPIGPPLPEMVQQLSPELSEDDLRRVVAAFRHQYDHSDLASTSPYPGIPSLLQELSAPGVRMFLVTNKPKGPTAKILDRLNLTSLFLDVVTPDSLPHQRATKLEMIRHLSRLRELSASKTIVIGDAASDIEAAHAAGMVSVGVLYGYGKPSDIAAARPTYVAPTVDSLRSLLLATIVPQRLPPSDGDIRAGLAAHGEESLAAANWGIHTRETHNQRTPMRPRDSGVSSMSNSIFDELFVLEMANNHWGSVQRGLRIVRNYGQVVRFNNMKAAIKLQLRDVDRFIHKDFVDRADIRYIKKTLDTRLSKEHFAKLVAAIRRNGCIPAATPFDEASVDLCVELGIQIIKLASSDLNDWVLIEKIAKTRKPVIASLGGSSLKDAEDLVTFFNNRNIPLAINHCTSVYPTEDDDLELNQIDFLRNRFPSNVIGFSTHEYHDWTSSILVAYAKGARTFERHIDIELDGVAVSPYCSLPHQIDAWFKAFRHAKKICGAPGYHKRMPPEKEIKYLDSLIRGVYALRDLPEGHILTTDDVYLAVPLQKGQISCRELMHDEMLLKPCAKDQPIMIDMIDGPYATNESLKQWVYERGL
jgi:N-acetylneuraminate synthase